VTDVSTAALPVAVVVALLAGLVSFASPCVLPLVPGFLGYVTGAPDRAPSGPPGSVGRSRTVAGALLFVAGFSVVFLVVSLAATTAGAALREHESLLTRLGGVLVVGLALVYLGVGGRFTQRELVVTRRPATGLLGAPLLGAIFAVGWTPCTSPTLGTILSMAVPLAGDAPVARAAALAAAYSLGLGMPFVLLAAGWSRATRASAWLRRHQRGVHLAGGLLLLIVGLLMASGAWSGIMSWVQSRLIVPFTTVL
jgi:cytochrome c-type biogenesis protein